MGWTGCTSKKGTSKQSSPQEKKPSSATPKTGAHDITKETEQKILRQAREDIEIIVGVTDDVAPLKKALTGKALKDMTANIKKDLGEGKIKKRRYDNVKITFKNFTKKIAGLRLEFIDNSYYVDKSSGKTLTKPQEVPRHYGLALIEHEGRWKIYQILAKTKPRKNKTNTN